MRAWFQRFLPRVKKFLFSRYVSPKLEPAGQDSPISYTLFKKSCQKWVKNIIFSHILKFIFGFYVFSSVNQWDWPVYNKKVQKSAASAFCGQFYAENWPKYREFPLFYKTRDISKSLRVRFLKLGMSVRSEIWTSYSLYMPLKSYRGDFENFFCVKTDGSFD